MEILLFDSEREAMSNNARIKKRLFVIGLDGATFDIITPLIKEGRLENISSLMEQGTWGELRSTIPAFSPVAWTSLVTGVNPGKHGITDAFIHHLAEYRISFVNSTYRKYKPIWSALNTFGNKTGIVNVPLTYPPEHVDGFIITGMFTPENAVDFIYPPELKDILKRKFGKYIFEGVQSDKLERVLRTTYNVIDQHDDIALYLLDEHDLDFFFLVYVETDRIQHQFWKFMDEKNTTVSRKERKRYKNVIKDLYQRMDVSIGKILKQLRDEDTLMIVSDHGFGPLYKAFSLSNWLIEQGYTVYNKNVKDRSSFALLKKVKDRFLGGNAEKNEELNRYLCNVDWKRTRAFTEGAAGGIFINMEGRQKEGIISEGEEYERLCSEIANSLKEVIDPSTGIKVVEEVYLRKDIYWGDKFDTAPDLVVVCSRGFHTISPSECSYYKIYNKDIFFTHKWSGRHEDNGIIIMKGPKIKKGYKLKGANILDVAPTILFLMDKPSSREFDGEILLNAIENYSITSDPINYTDSYNLKIGRGAEKEFSLEESALIKERLKSLGYIE
jgi:predicted AlkP superfamily phosphohydrolase/phosphomutase